MDKTNKEFKITFTRCKDGWIDFDVSYGDETISYPFTHIWHSPGDLLQFAKRVYKDNKGILNCDAEGWERTKPDGYWGEPVMQLKSKLFDKLFQLEV